MVQQTDHGVKLKVTWTFMSEMYKWPNKSKRNGVKRVKLGE